MLGLMKGFLLGVAIGAVVHFGFEWRVTPGLSGYLIAMGTGATAGVIAGRPPWRREAWLEGILKAFVGLGVALGLYWLGIRFLTASVPFGLLGAPKGVPWMELPLLYAPVVAALYGALVELDNTPAKPAGGSEAGAPPTPFDGPRWED